jgi:glycosyltransferase involved in cell wall biosynthesis
MPNVASADATAAASEENQAEGPSDRVDEMPGNQRITWEMRRQVPFVRNGGLLNRKETAIVGYIDGDLFPPAAMAAIQRGIFYWLTVGLDVGGDLGVFQVLLRIKQEMARTRKTNFFFWGWHVRTGYKYINVDLTDSWSDVWQFDDNSWVLSFENVFAFRFGNHRRRVLYINTQVYWDFDLRGEGRQTDLYVFPAMVGFESIIGHHWNLFFEAGLIMSINGWETADRVISEDGDMFPTASFGFAYRFGGVRTALPADWTDPTSQPLF